MTQMHTHGLQSAPMVWAIMTKAPGNDERGEAPGGVGLRRDGRHPYWAWKKHDEAREGQLRA